MSDITWHKFIPVPERTDTGEHSAIGFEDIVLYKLEFDNDYVEYFVGDGEDYWDQKEEIRKAVAFAIIEKEV